MEFTTQMVVFSAQQGVIDFDAEGNALPLEKQFRWNTLIGLSSVPASDENIIGNKITKMPFEPSIWPKLKTLLKPGETPTLSLLCEMRSGAKQKATIFVLDVDLAK